MKTEIRPGKKACMYKNHSANAVLGGFFPETNL